MKEKFKVTALERNWILYDIGNSAFTLLVSTLFPSTSILWLAPPVSTRICT